MAAAPVVNGRAGANAAGPWQWYNDLVKALSALGVAVSKELHGIVALPRCGRPKLVQLRTARPHFVGTLFLQCLRAIAAQKEAHRFFVP